MSEQPNKGKVIIRDDKSIMALQRKKADQEAIKLVHAFMNKYSMLDENDDNGHSDNEKILIEGICDIYDPPEYKE